MNLKITITTAMILLITALVFACQKSTDPQNTGSDGDTSDMKTESQTSVSGDKTTLPVYDTDKTITADFSKRDYSQTAYLKKFDMFTATWGWCNDFSAVPVADAKNLGRVSGISALLPEVIRTDLFMGYYGIGRNIGSSASLKGMTDGEYYLVKDVTNTLKANKLSAEFIYFASPVYSGGGLQNDKWKSVGDLEKWNELCFNIASYFKENDMNVIRHEIWNEPDYYITNPTKDGVYFMGSWQDYINVYINGALGVRKADPDALIGGVSAAWMNKISKNGEFLAFLEQSEKSNILPDYISWHFYGSNGGMSALENYITGARGCLESSDSYSAVQQHLNEFNVSLDSKVTKGYTMVRSVLSAYSRLLDATDITRVAWTSALDRDLEGSDGQALIDPKTGERTPAFYTMWMYARLPVMPVTVSCDTSKVTVMASVGSTRAGLIAYDTGLESSDVTINLKGIGFENCNVTVYVIDKKNPQNRVTSNTPLVFEKFENVNTENMSYSVKIPEDGAIYIEINDVSSETAVHERINELKDNVVRTDYWYNGRDDSGAYAWFGTNSFTAAVGSGTSDISKGTVCAVTLDNMKNVKLSIDAIISDGARKLDNESMLGITVAYSENGNYTKTVYYYFNDIDGSAKIPLGTSRAADQKISLGTGSGTYSLDFAAAAPGNWDGRIQLGFIVNNISKSQGAEFIINKP